MSRRRAARDARLRSTSPVTTAGSVSTGAGGEPPPRRPRENRVRKRRDEAVALQDGLQRVPGQRIGPAHHVQEGGPARGRGQARGAVDEQPSAGLEHRRHRRQLPHGQPQGLHGVGHHLLVTDGEVDAVLLVTALGEGVQRRDRPALHDAETVVGQTPFDVLRTAEVRLDPPPEPHEFGDLCVRQRRQLLPLRLDLHRPRTPARHGMHGPLFDADRPGDDLAVPHREHVRVHQAGHQGLAESETGVHGGDRTVAGDRVGREQDAGRLGHDHLLHDHGHADRPVVDALLPAVGHGPLGEQRGPAPADVPQDLRGPQHVEVRVLLAGERGRRQVLRGRAGPHGVRGLLAGPRERTRDRRGDLVRQGRLLDRPADLRAERAECLPVVRIDARQPLDPVHHLRSPLHRPPEGPGRHTEALRHPNALDPMQLAQVCPLATHDRDVFPVDLFQIPHVPLDHRDSSVSAGSGLGRRFCGTTGALPQAPRCAIP